MSHSSSSPKSNPQQHRLSREAEAVSPFRREYDSQNRAVSKDLHTSNEQGIPWMTKASELRQEVMTVALSEVQDFMALYANCPDPSESAARRERVRQAEAKGQVEKSAAQIVRASLARSDSQGVLTGPLPTSIERVTIADQLGPLNQEESPKLNVDPSANRDLAARLHVSCRLGPLVEDSINVETNAVIAPQQTQKRKPGRPPGKRVTNGSPAMLLPGASSRKRKVQQTKTPYCRKKLQIEPECMTKTAKGTRRKVALEEEEFVETPKSGYDIASLASTCRLASPSLRQ
ncbi:hypothetical protein F2Q69_00020505 [Brassica cretica]|uniref:Uncharacterized protein n=1 Tax=Brassica cretica TaxID=69181 RepID=A0A8S9QMM7_BRACR|nr:hypothetical protein F2Q69_00020505 [Brassica cretica]